MQSKRLTCALALAVAFAAASQPDEQAFIKEAVQGNLAEVQLGELAAQRLPDELECHGGSPGDGARSTGAAHHPAQHRHRLAPGGLEAATQDLVGTVLTVDLDQRATEPEVTDLPAGGEAQSKLNPEHGVARVAASVGGGAETWHAATP